jgi:uncharacterized membrane protein YeaQ/YmgE (transglycosylase-associated protein family)
LAGIVILTWFATALVGMIVGWVAAVRAPPGLRPFILYIPVGAIGAIVGVWLLGLAGVATTGPGGLLLRAVVGAIVPILIVRWVEKRRS